MRARGSELQAGGRELRSARRLLLGKLRSDAEHLRDSGRKLQTRRRKLFGADRMLHAGMRRRALRIDGMRLGQPGLHQRCSVLQRNLHECPLPAAERGMQDRGQHLCSARRLLLEVLLQRQVLGPAVVLLPERRSVRRRRGVLHRDLHQAIRRRGRDLHRVQFTRYHRLLDCRPGVRRGRHRRRRCGQERRGNSGLRRRMLQPFLRALRADGSADLPAAERLPADRRDLPGGRGLLRLTRSSRRQRLGPLQQVRGRTGGALRQRQRLPRCGRGLQTRDHFLQRGKQLLRRQRQPGSHRLPAGFARHSALHGRRRLHGGGIEGRSALCDER